MSKGLLKACVRVFPGLGSRETSMGVTALCEAVLSSLGVGLSLGLVVVDPWESHGNLWWKSHKRHRFRVGFRP